MQPQQGEVPGLRGGLGVSPHDPLDDPGNIPLIEGVVGFRGGGKQLLPDLVVDFDGAVDHCICD